MDTGLDGKVVLITGATRNHGRASALAFAAEGANLLLCTRQSMDLLEETAQEASASGVRTVTKLCDVTDPDQVDSLVKTGMEKFGRIDVVVNNAGWRARGSLLDITAEQWEAALAVNVHAPFIMCQAVIPGMKERRFGRIINYSGIAPFRGASGQGTLKRANEGLTRAIAREYGRFNITANCIGPGSIDVERTAGQESGHETARELPDVPVPRHGTVQECSAMVVFLASEQAAYISGQTYLVNGGAYFL